MVTNANFIRFIKERSMSIRGRFGFFASLLLLTLSIQVSAQEWPQWGGPNRNFVVKAKGLAAKWPAEGPKKLWTRPLGEGHSAVLVDGKTLYTMYSAGEQEVVIALAADTGKTIWEHKYAAPTAGLDYEYGFGPHATPVVAGNLLFTVGSIGQLNALDKRTGKIVWGHDLWKDFGGKKMDRGYSCSPLLYKDTLILTLGGKDQTLIAFNQKGREGSMEEFDARHVTVIAHSNKRRWPGADGGVF